MGVFSWCVCLLAVTARAARAAACAPSSVIQGGCELLGGAGVALHYALAPEAITVALRAQTRGYVAVGFVPTGQDAMFPADAVVGWMGDTSSGVVPYQVNGYLPVDVIASGVRLSNTSVEEDADGWTTVRFTRRLQAGRFPLADLSDVTLNLAQGASDGLAGHTQAATLRANLLTGAPRADPPASNATDTTLALVFACTAVVVGMYAVV